MTFVYKSININPVIVDNYIVTKEPGLESKYQIEVLDNLIGVSLNRYDDGVLQSKDPATEVRGYTDTNGNIAGLIGTNTGILPVKWTPRSRIEALGAKPIGFNYYSLIYEALIGISNNATNRVTQLAYIKSTGANIIRIALPCFSGAEYLSRVHFTGSMPSTMSDDNLRSTYISTLDSIFDQVAVLGMKLHISDFWGQSVLPVALGETLATGYVSTSTATAVYMKSAAEWLVRRYGKHPAFGVYSIGNEWVTDAAGATAPTPTQLGAIFSMISDAVHAVNQGIPVTADISGAGSNVLKTRLTPEQHAVDLGILFAKLDAVCMHLYNENFNYVGRIAADNASFPNTNSTTLGYEGAASIVEAYASVAASMDKPFMLGEFGVSTANESDALTYKKRKFMRAVLPFATYALWWNVQDSVVASSSGQSTWFIQPGTTRGNTFLALALEANTSKPIPRRIAGGTKSLRDSIRPTSCMTSTRSAGAVVSLTSTATQSVTNMAVACWLRLNASLTSFEAILDLRGASNFNGFVMIGDSVAATSVYGEFRAAAGGAGNTSGALADLVVGEWNHLAFTWEALNGSTAITVWVNGLFWKTLSTAGTLGAIPASTVLEILGSTSGTPISMQDVTMCQSMSAEDVWAHMRGEVLPHSLMHVRALANGTVVDLGVSKLAVTVGGGVTVEPT